MRNTVQQILLLYFLNKTLQEVKWFIETLLNMNALEF